MKDLIRPCCNENKDSEKNKIWLGQMKYQLIWLNLVEKLLPTGLYDHGMIKDDQTSQ